METTTKKDLTKTDMITVLCVFLLTIFIIALFLMNKSNWEQKLALAQASNATNGKTEKIDEKELPPTSTNENTLVVDKALLEAQKEEANTDDSNENTIENDKQGNQELIAEIEKLKQENRNLKTADSVRMNGFMAMASYKIYGLYKDKSGKLTDKDVAKKFNIKSEKAIKIAEINGEKAYVVPVKGVHIAKSGDTAFSIAKKYYKNDKQAKLVEDFNGEIQAGQTVFLPFN